jgi:hypothetical protein
MNESTVVKRGRLALALCLGGLAFSVAVAMLARLLGHDAGPLAYVLFLGFQVAGFMLGLASRGEALGKAATIASAVLAICSLLFLS